ncbi:hypothetical protein BDV97DRAFT_118656 [Delphinella strobiligena]|nr:hypothetical protein BDV97DRAFT_118656 [Delphinella strobiligena]
MLSYNIQMVPHQSALDTGNRSTPRGARGKASSTFSTIRFLWAIFGIPSSTSINAWKFTPLKLTTSSDMAFGGRWVRDSVTLRRSRVEILPFIAAVSSWLFHKITLAEVSTRTQSASPVNNLINPLSPSLFQVDRNATSALDSTSAEQCTSRLNKPPYHHWTPLRWLATRIPRKELNSA